MRLPEFAPQGILRHIAFPRFVRRMALAGTARYTTRERRGLVVANLTGYLATISSLAYALTYALQDFTELSPIVYGNLLSAVCTAITPLFHRFGRTAAALWLAFVIYTTIFYFISMLGHDAGVQLNYIGAAAVALVILGVERLKLAIVMAAVAMAMHVAGLVPLSRRGRRRCRRPGLPQPGLSHLRHQHHGYRLRDGVVCDWRSPARPNGAPTACSTTSCPFPSSTACARLRTRRWPSVSKRQPSCLPTSPASPRSPPDWGRDASSPCSMTCFPPSTISPPATVWRRSRPSAMPTWRLRASPCHARDHAAAVADMALAMPAAAAAAGKRHGETLEIHVGIASGPVMAGIIGRTRFSYDVWGDTVNLAARLEAWGGSGTILASRSVAERLTASHDFEPLGTAELKGIGEVEVFRLVGRKSDEIENRRPRCYIRETSPFELRTTPFRHDDQTNRL